MPAPWLLLQTAVLAVAQAQANVPQTQVLPGNVKVTYGSGYHNLVDDTWAFDQGVVLDYDVTEIRADHIDVDAGHQNGSASGHVELDDPVGRIRADKLQVWWSMDGNRGHAENAEINVGSSHLKAATVDMTPQLWVLKDVEVTTSIAHPPWYEIRSSLLTLKPGQSGRMRRPVVYILGRRILSIPDQSFNLDQRSEGLTLPGLNYSRQYGLGASWGGGFLLDHRTDMAFAVGAFPDARPGYGASVSRSLLPDSVPTTLITPISDFGERFSYGFLENVTVASPEGEDRFMHSPRLTVSMDSVWNQALFDRNSPQTFSKAIEGVVETGGNFNGYGYISQARIQTINELDYPFATRLELIDSLEAPVHYIWPKVRTLDRLDTDIFLGETGYGWMRGILGLAYLPIPQVRLSAGGYYSVDAGRPELPIDPLYSHDGYVTRLDLRLGPTKASYMLKYDSAMGFYDHEYSISQVVGCLEPYIAYRETPTYYQLGFRFRFDNLTDLLTQRDIKRPPTAPTVLSPLPDGRP